MEKVIEVKNLSYSYGDIKILKDVSLDIYEGQTLVILGQSGCGKSTFLKNIIGLSTPKQGDIKILGSSMTAAGEQEAYSLRKNIGVLFQHGALISAFTVAENIKLPLMKHAQLDEGVLDIVTKMKLELVGLTGRGNLYPSELSGGMKKRAALARSIALDPKILFCDEPGAGLDPIIASGLDDMLIKLKEALNVTIIVVTHEMESAYKIADRIVMFYQGEIIFDGTKDEFIKCEKPEVVRFRERDASEFNIATEEYIKELRGD